MANTSRNSALRWLKNRKNVISPNPGYRGALLRLLSLPLICYNITFQQMEIRFSREFLFSTKVAELRLRSKLAGNSSVMGQSEARSAARRTLRRPRQFEGQRERASACGPRANAVCGLLT